MKRIPSAVLMLTLLPAPAPAPAFAQGAALQQPGASDPAQLVPDTRDLSAALEEIRASLDVPSLAAAAYRNGKLVGAGAAGTYSTKHPTPVGPTSRYHIGSCSKAMTAVLLGIVIEETDGLDWGTTLTDAVPDDAEFINAAYSQATIRDLLGHRSGLIESRDPSLAQLGWTITRNFADATLPDQRRELLRTALASDPAAEPSTEFGYSNFAYIIAAAIIEAHVGSSYEELVAERIFEPLGMRTAGFGPPGEPNSVTEPLGHSKQTDWTPIDPGTPGVVADNPPVFNSAGRVHASVVDWGRFVDDFQQGLNGKGVLLRPETYRIIATDPESDGYALGWSLNQQPWAGESPALTHAGSNTMWFAVAWIAPDKDLSFVAATNAATPEARRSTNEAILTMIDRFATQAPPIGNQNPRGPTNDYASTGWLSLRIAASAPFMERASSAELSDRSTAAFLIPPSAITSSTFTVTRFDTPRSCIVMP
ncbi:MAG: serine hydrolase domain-containing protein [Planctomycetota bacterium]